MQVALHDVLVHLAADRRRRDRFFADPSGACAEWGVPAEAAAALQAIPRDRLERYAESLLAKRAAELATALPVTVRVFPPVLDLYRRWLARNPAPVADDVLTPGLREALRALPHLVPDLEPEWVAELAPYEALSRASARDGRRRTFTSRWPVHRLLREVAAGDIPVDPDPEPQRYVFP
jgi:hypothetical protein